jgi:hypothetical protein
MTAKRTAIRSIEAENADPTCTMVSFDNPESAPLRLEVWGAKRLAVAWLTADEARALANELLKAAGTLANF